MNRIDNENIEIVKENDIFDGFFGFKQYELKYKRFDGKMSNTVNREIFYSKKAIVIIPYDPINDTVVLVEQIRFASAMTGGETYVKEVPAGIIDGDDTPLETAYRELSEETGITTKEIIPIYDYMPSPGCMTEHIWLFAGIVDSTKASDFAGLEEEGEDIKVHIIKYDDIIKMLHNNEIRNANTVIAVQWLMLNRERLRKEYK